MSTNNSDSNSSQTKEQQMEASDAADAAFRTKYVEQKEKSDQPLPTDTSQLGSYEDAVKSAYEGSKAWRASVGKSEFDADFEELQRKGISDAPLSSSSSSTATSSSSSAAAAKKAAAMKPTKVGAGGAHPLDAPSSSASSNVSDAINDTGAAAAGGDTGKGSHDQTPPELRAVVDFSVKLSQSVNQWGRCASGGQGALMLSGKPLAFSGGFRDMSRGYDRDDKGNTMRLYDPMGVGSLSLCMTATAAWHMHVEGLWNIQEPIRNFIPELPQCFGDDARNGVTIRDIFAGRWGQGGEWDAAVFDSLGVARPRGMPGPTGGGLGMLTSTSSLSSLINPWRRRFPSPADLDSQHELCYAPLVAALGGAVDGAAQRQALISHLASSSHFTSSSSSPSTARRHGAAAITCLKRHPLKGARHSHFAAALAAAAMERVMSKCHNQVTTFEDSITEGLFKHKNASSIGFGAPEKIRSKTFYEPQGTPAGHYSEKIVYQPKDKRNAAPTIFNASLNMYGKTEDLATVVYSGFDAVHEATTGIRFPQEDAESNNFTGSNKNKASSSASSRRPKQQQAHRAKRSDGSITGDVESRGEREMGPNKLPPPPESDSHNHSNSGTNNALAASSYYELGFSVFHARERKQEKKSFFSSLFSSSSPASSSSASSSANEKNHEKNGAAGAEGGRSAEKEDEEEEDENFLPLHMTNRYFHQPSIMDKGVSTPWAASAVYIPGLDMGSFSILNCGSWRARLNSTATSNLLVKYYRDHVIIENQKKQMEEAKEKRKLERKKKRRARAEGGGECSQEGANRFDDDLLDDDDDFSSMPTSEADLELILKQKAERKSMAAVTAETLKEEKLSQKHLYGGTMHTRF